MQLTVRPRNRREYSLASAFCSGTELPTDKLTTIGTKVMGWHVSFGAMSPVNERELRTYVSLLFVCARSHRFSLACGTQRKKNSI
jgi:hypothetical protein